MEEGWIQSNAEKSCERNDALRGRQCKGKDLKPNTTYVGRPEGLQTFVIQSVGAGEDSPASLMKCPNPDGAAVEKLVEAGD